MEHPSLLSLPSAHLGPEGPPFFITYSLTRQKNITQLYVTLTSATTGHGSGDCWNILEKCLPQFLGWSEGGNVGVEKR